MPDNERVVRDDAFDTTHVDVDGLAVCLGLGLKLLERKGRWCRAIFAAGKEQADERGNSRVVQRAERQTKARTGQD